MRMHKTISCSVTGYHKLLEGKPCEDATRVIHTKSGTIMAVADGHGDYRCIFAHVGSQLAVRAACEVLKYFGKQVKSEDPSVYWNSRREAIAQGVVQTFSRLVMADYISRCPVSVEAEEKEELLAFIDGLFTKENVVYAPEQVRQKYAQKKRLGDKLQSILYLYGTTVRASFIGKNYMFHMALGDGDTIILVDDRIEWVLPKSEAYECETASLCEDPQCIINDFLFSYTELKTESLSDGTVDQIAICPRMLALSTDGLRNSFYSDDGFSKKMKEIGDIKPNEGRSPLRCLKSLFVRLTRESVFQDDISAIFVKM